MSRAAQAILSRTSDSEEESVSILEIESWEPLSPADAFKRTGPNNPKPTRLVCGKELKPADAYCYLKARFGQANGLLMFAVPPSSDNIIYWHYTVAAGTDTLHIQGISARVEFMASSSPPLTKSEWRKVIEQLKGDFARMGPQMKLVRASLEPWKIFVNPYYRLEKIVADLHARIVDLKLEKREFPELSWNTTGTRVKSMKKLISRYERAAEWGMSLRMIAPVWGESFVNLVIFLLAKEDVRNNSRLYQDLLRKSIDVRIAGLHLHCEGFAGQVDLSHDAAKGFLEVFNSRNEFLHGNVDPIRLAIDEVYFEGKIPLFKRHQTYTERGLMPRLRHIEPEVAKKDVYLIEEFITYVLSQLDPPWQKLVKIFMDNPFPGWREDTGKPGILFSDVIADFVTPFEEPEEG
jgi:hypothetical protein